MGEETKEPKKNIFEIEAEEKLRELAKKYWLKYHLSTLGEKDEVGTETAHEAYERYLERLENFGMLPSPRITEIVNEVQKEARQDAEAQIREENELKISQLN